MVTRTTPARPARLSARDRCDACGSRAYVAAEMFGTDLMFCGHHARKHELVLTALAAEFLDERWQLDDEETRRKAYYT